MDMNYEQGIVNKGSLVKLHRIMEKAMQGEKITLGFLGGSITQGALATSSENCYAYRVFQWWQQAFPKAEFVYVNAGIGGTTSHFGVARVEEDLLSQNPDLVLIEFSVNDENNDHFEETYEGLVRKVLKSPQKPAVVLVHNVFYNNGASAQLIHMKIGRHYQLPCISMQSTIYEQVLEGKLESRSITPDDLHPNDFGHELVALVIDYFFDKVRRELLEMEDLPEPLTPNAYECARKYDNRNTSPVLEGFIRDISESKDITDCFKNGWIGKKQGNRITFEVEGNTIAVQYKKSVKKPACIAKITLDQNPLWETILDGNFEEDWGDKLELTTITVPMASNSHTVEIEVIEDYEGKGAPFYLAGVIIGA